MELMLDLETLDTTNSAVVLSVGAVLFSTEKYAGGRLFWDVEDRFYRILDIQQQLDAKRTVSQSTLLWWLRQDSTARAEAFHPVRQDVEQTLEELCDFSKGHLITKFWANPTTFDYPIWEDLALTFQSAVPWNYNQKYDVRTAVSEAKYSAKDHVATVPIVGVAHTPIYDCEWQIDMLVAARNKAAGK
jgi:hypothetical protein